MSEEWTEFKWTVLVIDDDPDILRVAERALLPEGLAVLTSDVPQKGFEIARDHPSVHLILLDIDMPGEDGLSLLKRLAENEWTSEIPVVMLTARGAVADFAKARERGAFDYVTKPFAPPTLVRRVRRAFAYSYFGRDKITDTDGSEFRRIPPRRLRDYGGAAAQLADPGEEASTVDDELASDDELETIRVDDVVDGSADAGAADADADADADDDDGDTRSDGSTDAADDAGDDDDGDTKSDGSADAAEDAGDDATRSDGPADAADERVDELAETRSDEDDDDADDAPEAGNAPSEETTSSDGDGDEGDGGAEKAEKAEKGDEGDDAEKAEEADDAAKAEDAAAG